MQITWLGHACFRVSGDPGVLYLDPFVEDNPVSPVSIEELDDADWVLVSHGHTDHYSDALRVLQQSDATLVSNFEITEDVQDQGHSKVEPMNIGGSIESQGLTIHMTEAQHSSGPGLGHQAGFVVDWNGTSIYHSGDTGLFSDMQLIGDFLEPDLAMLPIGDRFTMGPSSAAAAVDYLGVDQVIPMHYNTFEYVEQDPQNFVEKVGSSADVVVLNPGETHQLL
jgi:L-ascorbate metabolism protein UlaG (beta-lactamase superfamily)